MDVFQISSDIQILVVNSTGLSRGFGNNIFWKHSQRGIHGVLQIIFFENIINGFFTGFESDIFPASPVLKQSKKGYPEGVWESWRSMDSFRISVFLSKASLIKKKLTKYMVTLTG